MTKSDPEQMIESQRYMVGIGVWRKKAHQGIMAYFDLG